MSRSWERNQKEWSPVTTSRTSWTGPPCEQWRSFHLSHPGHCFLRSIQILLLLSFWFSLFCFVFREEVIYCFYWKGARVVYHCSSEILQTRLIMNNWGRTFIGNIFLRLGQYMGPKTMVTPNEKMTSPHASSRPAWTRAQQAGTAFHPAGGESTKGWRPSHSP